MYLSITAKVMLVTTLSYVVSAFLALAVVQGATLSDQYNGPSIKTNVGLTSRILEGTRADIEDMPWQVSLRMVAFTGGVEGCGGIVIHSRWILTAAHCIFQRSFSTIRLGGSNITLPDLVLESATFHPHPLYNSVNLNNDIGLINLGRDLDYTSKIAPIRIHSSTEAIALGANQIVQASGFGLTEDRSHGGVGSEVLYYVDLFTVSNDLCAQFYNSDTLQVVLPSSICTIGFFDPRAGTCQGDSGGPLVQIVNGVPTLIGIASFVSGAGCHENHPAGFVRPGFYHPWLTQVTGINFDTLWN